MKNTFTRLLLALSFFTLTACSTTKLSNEQQANATEPDIINAQPWQNLQTKQRLQTRAVHVIHSTTNQELIKLAKDLPKLAKMGINTLILEVDYHFEFQSHPELRQTDNVITKVEARRFAAIARANGIRVIPQFQTVGHQSWAENTFKLLTVYPELDLTPGAFPNNEGIYCREWDVMNPRVNEIVFALIGEIIDAFEADAIHVGMDEVFLIGTDESPTTKGMDTGEILAMVINQFHDFLVKEKGVEMWMWGDRLINFAEHKYGTWEASANGTWTAIDKIPKDIVINDWHYENLSVYNNGQGMDSYSSLPMFLEKGFRVVPASWRKLSSMADYMLESLEQQHPNMLGHMFTIWSPVLSKNVAEYKPLIEGLKLAKPYFAEHTLDKNQTP